MQIFSMTYALFDFLHIREGGETRVDEVARARPAPPPATSEIKTPNSHAVSPTSRACHCLSASPTIILGQFAATAVSLRLSHEIILWPVNDRLITSSSRDAATERQSVNDNIVFSQAWNISQNSTNDSSSIILFPSVFRHETSLLSNL